MIKQSVFKEEDREYFWDLYTHVSTTINMWHFHREITVEISDENYDLINKIAPNFYHQVMFRALSHDVLLGIARSTEKRARKKNDIISIYGIPKRIPDEAARATIKNLIKSKECHFQKPEFWRHNHLAHHGIKFMNSQNQNRDLKNKEVKAALEALSEIIHACMPIFGFQNELLNTNLDILAAQDMKNLFKVLQKGQVILDT